jgi:hypothetical protein
MMRKANDSIEEDLATSSATSSKAPAIVTEPKRFRYRVLKPIHLVVRGTPGKLGTDVSGNRQVLQGGIDEEICYWPRETVVDGKAVTTTFAMIPGCVMINQNEAMIPSGGHGGLIPIDLSGEVWLTEKQVMEFRHGQIEPIDPGAPLVPSGLIDIIDQEQLAMARGNLEGPDDPREAIRQLAERQAAQEERMRAMERHVRVG